ncbi:AAA family ATPase [Mycoplasmopsis phocirhinis]|uniref:AAA family ATPase n=1 Tax=Mycoplasmopsis phocirhinis TaxID=142650 RepID=A0A4P6MPG8_9BACT|nr:ATP-binding protein [Mycoplasmopsis phocirhinis]QBF34626.1 AAA family ATPase [Mycoplasmopsis phocirhinis]
MKKANILNLIKYHSEKNDIAFRLEAMKIAKYFDSIGDYELSEYVISLVSSTEHLAPQVYDSKNEFIKKIDLNFNQELNLPAPIIKEINGVINSISYNIGMNKFLFEGPPGSGKTESAKQIARILNKDLYYVDFNSLIDSKLGSTNKNIEKLFNEIEQANLDNNKIILFDEIDSIALDRINANDVREMGRATSSLLKEFDNLINKNSQTLIIATTNLFKNLDKALARRFDAVINFNRYTKNDLIRIGLRFFSDFAKKIKLNNKDSVFLTKVFETCPTLPFPAELKNIIKTSLAFSNNDEEYDYIKNIYTRLNGDLIDKSIAQLDREGFTVRQIGALKDIPKSTVAFKLKNGEDNEK